jgi:hypothetical protein
MIANAQAMSDTATLAGNLFIASGWDQLAVEILRNMENQLWSSELQF